MLLRLVALWLALLLGGCAVAPAPPPGEVVGPFRLTATAVEQVILRAFRQGWPELEAKPLAAPRIGYQLQVWRLADADSLVAEAFAAPERGFTIRVHNARYLSQSEDPAREKLVRLIAAEARRQEPQPGRGE